MNEASWREIDDAVGQLIDVPDEELTGRLDRLQLRPEIRCRVEALLKASRESTGFLETPLLSFDAPTPDRMIDMRLGAWRLMSLIGEGGMGAVYRAERDDQEFSQTAAVKLIASGRMNQSLASRFREERQILARLEHPNIARLIDGGIGSDGTPFLVMEYVDGCPLDEWCAQRQLSLNDRIALFRQVCAAVQYAHQNLVVHCDLKPSNMLVTRDGTVKLLDFGIARMVSSQREMTEPLLRRMTLDYASPEQVRGMPLTTASDVYSLGVVLFQLVCGKRPYEVGGKTLDEVLALICDREIAKPGSGSTDLDAILLKALHKDPVERYVSVAAFSADLQRFVNGMAVEAQPPTAMYLFRRFVARHRAAVASTVAVLLFAIVAGAMIVRQSRIAERRFNSVRRLAHFVIFDMHDGVAPLAGSTPVRRMLVSQGLAYLDELSRDASSDPDLQREIAEAYLRLGEVLGNPAQPNLGDTAGALKSYRKALALLEPLSQRAPSNPAISKALIRTYQEIIEVEEDPRAALVIAQHLVDVRRIQSNASDDESRAGLARAYHYRAVAERELHDQEAAARDTEAALKIFEELLAAKPSDPRRQYNAALEHKALAARLMMLKRDPAVVEPHLRRAEDLDRARVAANPSDRSARTDLSFDLSQDAYFQWQSLHNFRAAIDLFTQALAIREELAKTDPADARLQKGIAYLLHSRGSTYAAAGDFHRAADDQAAAVRIRRELFQKDASVSNRRDYGLALNSLADAGDRLGGTAQACGDWQQAAQLLTVRAQEPPLSAGELETVAELSANLKRCPGAAALGGGRFSSK